MAAPAQSPADASEVVVVPREPTDDMHHAGQDVMETGNASDVWTAMLASRRAQPPIPAVCAEDVARDMAAAFERLMVSTKYDQADRDLFCAAREDCLRILSLLPGAGGVGSWSDWPRESQDLRYEIGAREEWDAPSCPFCSNAIDQTSAVTIIGGDCLHIVHTGCIPDDLLPAAPTSEGSSALRPSDCVPSGDVDGGAGR